jgi:endoribonuclease Dicer
LLPLTSVIQPDEDGEVKLLLEDVEKRAGLANVPIQMDPWAVSKTSETWWYNEITIGDLPALYMFTRCPLPSFSPEDLPTLYVPGQGPVAVTLRSGEVEVEEDGAIAEATEFTRRMFASLHSQRMISGKTDFCYVFLPIEESASDVLWKERRAWQEQRLATLQQSRLQSIDRVNAEALAEKFDHPLDLALVRSNEKYDKLLQFVGWHDGPLQPEEEEELQDKYDGYPDYELTFPLLYVQPFPRRANFLIPLDSDRDGLNREEPFVLHPRFATVDMMSVEHVQYAFQLPSALRWLSIAITVHDMRTTLFATIPALASIPFTLLKTAITAPASQDPVNYQRLETLGDTVLKYVTSIQLFSQYPIWHEGYLARRKDHAVNNNQLAKEAIRLGLEKWIIRDTFVPRKWRPRYADESTLPGQRQQQPQLPAQEATAEEAKSETADGAVGAEPDGQDRDKDAEDAEKPAQQRKKKKKRRTQQLSTKMLADVCESLIGAAYEHGGIALGLETIRLFGLGLYRWDSIPECINAALSRVELVNDLPSQLMLVEEMLGYQFTRPILQVEALTHGSFTGDIVDTVSYERLEFLGDAVLDMIVTDYLYHAEGKNYGPGQMHLRKESLVNSHILAYICLKTFVGVDTTMPAWNMQDGVFLTAETQRIYLHQCLLHSSPLVLDDLNVASARFEKHGDAIGRALEKAHIYPWAALTRLQAPKFISDLVESLLGAVFLDSNGNLDVVRGVLRHLGYMDIMERIVRDDVDVLHPVSRLAIWAAQHELKWEIKTEKADGNVSCAVLIEEEEVIRETAKYRGKVSLNEVRFAAAEGAVRKMNVIEEEEPDDADDMEWGDVPEYIV